MSRLVCAACERTYSGSDRSGGHCMTETSGAFALRATKAGTHLDAGLEQTPVDDGWISPDHRGYLVRSYATGVERDCDWHPGLVGMFSAMVGNAGRTKVLWSVVGAVPVQVVNVLSVRDDSVDHPVLVGFDVLELADSPPQSHVSVGGEIPLGREVRYLLARGQEADGLACALPLASGAISALWRSGDLGSAPGTRLGDNDAHTVILLVRSLCHQSFSAQGGFDKHRVGRYGVDRRCLTADEMTAKGWHMDDRGDWRMPSKGNPWTNHHPTDGLPAPSPQQAG